MSGRKRKIIDSHVHLWPPETANEDGHAWMPPGMPIAKARLPAHYLDATIQNEADHCDTELQGLVFVESDVRYDQPYGNLSDWARGPLDEISFARKIVEGDYGSRASRLLVGIVPWAPMDQPSCVLERFLDIAESTAGQTTWQRVKGFRFLLQSIVDQDRFKALVLGEHFVRNLKILGRRGFSFDVGVDQRSGGSWQLEVMAQAVQLAYKDVEEDEKVVFIINHLCKPDFSDTRVAFQRWADAISLTSRWPRTYMKLSGAFSELPTSLHLSKPSDIAHHLKPWLDHIFKSFGPERVMFGSDWPVCNLKGPGIKDSWTVWRDVVKVMLAKSEPRINDEDWVWSKAAEMAYKLT